MSSQLSAQWAEPPWGAKPRFELGPALQQASALPTYPRCTLTEPRCTREHLPALAGLVDPVQENIVPKER